MSDIAISGITLGEVLYYPLVVSVSCGMFANQDFNCFDPFFYRCDLGEVEMLYYGLLVQMLVLDDDDTVVMLYRPLAAACHLHHVLHTINQVCANDQVALVESEVCAAGISPIDHFNLVLVESNVSSLLPPTFFTIQFPVV